jgi:hypothetical protein
VSLGSLICSVFQLPIQVFRESGVSHLLATLQF